MYKRQGRSDKARELYDIAWKYLRPLWHFKLAALYAQDFQNILDKMADNGLSQSMLEKERTLISKLYRTAIGWRVVDANLASVLKVCLLYTSPPLVGYYNVAEGQIIPDTEKGRPLA